MSIANSYGNSGKEEKSASLKRGAASHQASHLHSSPQLYSRVQCTTYTVVCGYLDNGIPQILEELSHGTGHRGSLCFLLS